MQSRLLLGTEVSSGEALVWACEEPYLHLVSGGRAKKGQLEVEVGRLLEAAVVHGASWRQPDHHLQQVCTHNTPLSRLPHPHMTDQCPSIP